MFDREYIVKIYADGNAAPILEFTVYAMQIRVDGPTLHIDGIVLKYSDKHHITVEPKQL
jgi:hypothetical protein